MPTNIEEIKKLQEEAANLTQEVYADQIAVTSKKSTLEMKKLDLSSKTTELILELLVPTVSIIEISPVSTSIKTNEILQIEATCKDKNGVIIYCPILSWNSSNSNVATIDSNGIVHAVANGFTEITASYP